jgi:hypothetical protein
MLTAQMSDNLPEASLPNYLSNDWCKIFQNGTYMCDQWCTKTEVKKRFRFQKLFSWTIPGFCIVIALMYMPLPEAENVTDIEGYNFFCFVGKLPAQLVSQTSFFLLLDQLGVNLSWKSQLLQFVIFTVLFVVVAAISEVNRIPTASYFGMFICCCCGMRVCVCVCVCVFFFFSVCVCVCVCVCCMCVCFNRLIFVITFCCRQRSNSNIDLEPRVFSISCVANCWI